jgi:hypothetical protein
MPRGARAPTARPWSSRSSSKVEDPDAQAEVHRQLEGAVRQKADRVPQVIDVEVEAIALAVVADGADAEVEGLVASVEVLARQAGRRADHEAQAEALVGP